MMVLCHRNVVSKGTRSSGLGNRGTVLTRISMHRTQKIWEWNVYWGAGNISWCMKKRYSTKIVLYSKLDVRTDSWLRNRHIKLSTVVFHCLWIKDIKYSRAGHWIACLWTRKLGILGEIQSQFSFSRCLRSVACGEHERTPKVWGTTGECWVGSGSWVGNM